MAAAFQAQDSPRSRQPRRPSSTQTPPSDGPRALSPGIGDHDHFVASSPSKDASFSAAAGAGYDPPASADSLIENSQNEGGAKKKVWNKASNELVADISGGAVMGAESWPALSESARASAKSSSTSSLKALSRPSSVSALQEMPIDTLSSPKDVASGISSPNSNGDLAPSRQKSMKRGGGAISSSQNSKSTNDNLSHTQGGVVETPTNLVKSVGTVGQSSSRDAGQREEGSYGREAGQREEGSYGGNEVNPRPTFRRNNSGPLFRGDSGKRDHERNKHDWINSHRRSFGSRENNINAHQRRVGSRPFGPPPNASFMPHPTSPGTVRPYVTSMVYPEIPLIYVPGPHPDSVRPIPMVPMFFNPMADPFLHSKIVNQIDYYFSNENLVKDTFLRKNMDNEGWVPINLIAGFKKVLQLTDNIQLLLHSIQASNVVEVQGDKVRRKNDWFKWIMPPTEIIATSPLSINELSESMLGTHLNSVALGGKAIP